MKTYLHKPAMWIMALCLLTEWSSAQKSVNIKYGEEATEKVYAFVYEQVCEVLAKSITAPNGSRVQHFSRCPSGYYPQINGPGTVVSTDGYVNGKIVFYRGCKPLYVCDFKVCVDRQYVVLRTRGDKNYLGVSAWVAAHKQKEEAVAKQ